MVPVGPSASPRSGPWSVGRWPAPNSARSFALERPPRFALGFPLARKPMTSVLFTLGRAREGVNEATNRAYTIQIRSTSIRTVA